MGKLKILICKSGQYGGTDNLLDRCYNWLKHNGIFVEQVCLPNSDCSVKEAAYDLAILPSSQMHDIVTLRKKGIHIKRILIWIMGCGAFQETYYNPGRSKGIEKYVNKVLDHEARATLKKLYKRNSICFTDEVGMYASLHSLVIDYENKKESNIVPIVIQVPDEYVVKDKKKDTINISWVGRVSRDFKFIPIKHLIEAIEQYKKNNNINILLTMVGSGDALEELKEITNKISYKIEFINNIEYENLSGFLTKKTDLLIAMGTSALDGARYGCPTVITTPVRSSDKQEVNYRWVFESKGYSLGEYPGLDMYPNQIKKSFVEILEEYKERDDLQVCSYEYAKQFAPDVVFGKLLNRVLPDEIDFLLWKHLRRFYLIKKLKQNIKHIIKR